MIAPKWCNWVIILVFTEFSLYFFLNLFCDNNEWNLYENMIHLRKKVFLGRFCLLQQENHKNHKGGEFLMWSERERMRDTDYLGWEYDRLFIIQLHCIRKKNNKKIIIVAFIWYLQRGVIGYVYIFHLTYHLNLCAPSLSYPCVSSISWVLESTLLWSANWPHGLHFYNTPTSIFLYVCFSHVQWDF